MAIFTFFMNKIFIFALMFAILIVIKDAFLFASAYVRKQHMEMSTKRQIILGSAIAYIFTIIFTGLL